MRKRYRVKMIITLSNGKGYKAHSYFMSDDKELLERAELVVMAESDMCLKRVIAQSKNRTIRVVDTVFDVEEVELAFSGRYVPIDCGG